MPLAVDDYLQSHDHMKTLHKVAFSLLIFALGCDTAGLKLVQVTGTISVNKKPADGAIIYFHPNDAGLSSASAVAKSDGTFDIMYNGEKGIPAGNYKVTVMWPDPAKKPSESQIMMGTAEVGPDLLKGKYATKAASSLKAEITTSTQTLPPFDL